MAAKSNLCRRITLRESMEKLNSDGLDQVTRLLKTDFNIEISQKNKHSICKTIFFQTVTLSNEQLQTFENSLNTKILSLSKFINAKHVETKQSQGSISSSIASMEEKTDSLFLFPLVELPVDLISKIVLFLTEEQVFLIEKCCRLLYKIINDTLYLNQCNNFQTFYLTDERLEQISEGKYSFFKYCKAERLHIKSAATVSKNSKISRIDKFVNGLRDKWDKASKCWKRQGWYEIIFRSIKKLEINEDAMFLLDKIPVELLFDPEISSLEIIEELNYYWYSNDIKWLKNIMDQFGDKYLNFQNKLVEKRKEQEKEKEKQRGNIDINKLEDKEEETKGLVPVPMQVLKKLYTVKHVNGNCFAQMHKLAEIDVDHVILRNMMIDLNGKLTMKVLTFEDQIRVMNINEDNDDNYDTRNNNYNNNNTVQTLRLSCFNINSCNFCSNKSVIQTLQFDKSVKNMMIRTRLHYNIDENWKDGIESIIEKQYYKSVENVNLLLDIYVMHMDRMDWIFKLLKKHEQLLKYNFKCLNIGIRFTIDSKTSMQHIFEINSSIDNIGKFLNDNKKICLKKAHTGASACADEDDIRWDNLMNQWIQP